MDQVVSASCTCLRFRTVLLALFWALAVFIAAIGIYGVISHSVAQRTHEIGVRIALGARGTDVLKLVTAQGLRTTLIGVPAGIVGALAMSRFIASFLYGVKLTDLLT